MRRAVGPGGQPRAPQGRSAPLAPARPVVRARIGERGPHVVQQKVRVRPNPLRAEMGVASACAGHVAGGVTAGAARLFEQRRARRMRGASLRSGRGNAEIGGEIDHQLQQRGAQFDAVIPGPRGHAPAARLRRGAGTLGKQGIADTQILGKGAGDGVPQIGHIGFPAEAAQHPVLLGPTPHAIGATRNAVAIPVGRVGQGEDRRLGYQRDQAGAVNSRRMAQREQHLIAQRAVAEPGQHRPR